ncbi:PLP-dependent aminotransferase family protein [Dyadobacter sp. LHD-138]|uniref:aminotransferase-like domain-containing protein n=1 Tax=Dyadobacter sp. LHD-138 TaxID=3071413 RepID=UPI0027E18AE5|nr:PLP-dependent aminotransferase family protein [Dyadobacter sp. LHD-138]MDQ6477930.1 PLP-dependent aminotransferase family protein [Dyadobacter sp. LHD-138]
MEIIKDYLYLNIARQFESQIRDGVLKMGDKLPSVRQVSRERGISINTITQAYLELESLSLIESRPKSGFYVCYSQKRNLPVPSPSKPPLSALHQLEEDLIDKVYDSMREKNITLLSLGFPAAELLPIAKLNKGLVHAMRTLPDSGTGYEPVPGNEKLRNEIARLSFSWGGNLKAEDIVTTPGCISALSYCLTALAGPGDTIIVESPAYFGILQLAKSLRLKVIELPTNFITGIELDALKNTLSKRRIAACVLISNFNNPSGSLMPADHKKEVVRLMEYHNIPLIEDDIYGELYFGSHRPTNCKTYDESGLVLCCSSVSKTLAPGYRVGWVSPGRFKDQIMRTKLHHSLSSASITQEVVADFLKNGRYENHLRKIRATLYNNYRNYVKTINEHFPDHVKLTQPQGGFFLWLELEKGFDVISLYEKAMRFNISIAPGRMFSLHKQFQNCMRLNYGMYWNKELEKSLEILGMLISKT